LELARSYQRRKKYQRTVPGAKHGDVVSA